MQINKFKRAASRIFNSSIVEGTKKLMPARAQLLDGILIKPTYTQRIKVPVLQERPSVEKLNDNMGTLADTTAFQPGEEFLPKETTFDNLDADFEQTSYPWYENEDTNELVVRDTFDKDFSQRLELTWGTSSVDDTHFVSKKQDGIHGDGNTGYYETQNVFYMLGDCEFLTGSMINGLPRADYTKNTTFLNKKLLKTSETIQERELGTTLQYVSTDSSSYGKLLETNLRRPQNHITTFGGESHMNLGRTYEGYQHRGAIDNKTYSNDEKVSVDSNLIDRLAHDQLQQSDMASSPLSYEDLTTQAFYRIKLDNKGKGKLKVIRTDDDADGTL